MTLLPAIDMPLLADILPFDAEDISEDINTSHEPAKIKWYRQAVSTVASIAAIIIFMLFISTPIDNFQPTNDYAGLVAAELLSKQEICTSIDDTTAIDIIDEVITDINLDETVEIKDVIPTQEAISAEVTETLETPNYILVIGSLPTRNLAEKQIAEFASMGITEQINIYESNGRFRLYIDGYNTMQQAQQRLDEITTQSLVPVAGIWICSTR